MALPCKGCVGGGNGQSIGSTISQLSSIGSVAGCGRQQLGAAPWATSATLLQVVYKLKIVVVDYPLGGLLVKEDFTFTLPTLLYLSQV